MKKLLKTALTIGASIIIACAPAKKNNFKDNPTTLEEMLAPYTISQKEFVKKYMPKVESECTVSKDPDIYITKFDDRSTALIWVREFNCEPKIETRKRYIKHLIEGKILHGLYHVNGSTIQAIGQLEPEDNFYFNKYTLNTEDIFYFFDINRDGKPDFILYRDTPLYPAPVKNETSITARI